MEAHVISHIHGKAAQMKTDRLTIRPIQDTDWQSMQAIWQDFNHSEYVIYDTPKGTADADVQQRIVRWAAATKAGKEHLFFVACLNGQVIGFVSLNARQNAYEIGYGFLAAYQRNGYAKETISAILEYLRKNGTERVLAGTALKNIPSVRLLQSLGFVMTGTERLSFHTDKDGRNIFFEGGNFEKKLV